MDVARSSKYIGAILFALLLSACDIGGSKSSVPYNSLKQGCEGAAIQNRYVIKWKDGEITAASFKSEDEMREVLSHFASDIKLVENDMMLKALPVKSESDDSRATEQSMATSTWGQDAIEASAAWDQNVKGQGVVVAIVDSGVDITNPQLSPRVLHNSGEIANNGIDDDHNGYVDDVDGYWFWTDPDNSSHDTPNEIDTTGHGTHVAGIVAADHNTGSIEGIAPAAQIIPVGFMSGDPAYQGSGSLYDAARGIQYAVSRGARIINASWGGAACSQTLKDVVGDLEQQGVLFVDAAGNDGQDIDFEPEYPAAFGLPGQVVVGSFGPLGYQSQFSNFSTNLVHLLAPGEDILSTFDPNQKCSGVTGKTTCKMSGTSMASPFVAGTAALLMSDRPNATVAQIKQALMNSVVTGNFEVASHGKLDVKNALAALRAIVP